MAENSSVFERFPEFIREYIYSHGWESLRGVQVAAAETILNSDCNLLLTSSTASGKTEAAFFPILSELWENPSDTVSVLYIAMGLLFGSILTDKQVGGVCGALLTNLSAWFSGIWFDLELVGGTFKKISYALPFVHSVEMQRAIISGNYNDILPHLVWVLGYALVIIFIAIYLFLRQMKKN